MEMPETPLSKSDEVEAESDRSGVDKDVSERASTKRKFSFSLITKREPSEEIDFHPGPPLKKMFTMTEGELLENFYQQPPTPTSAGEVSSVSGGVSGQLSPGESYFSKRSPILQAPKMSPTHRRIVTRDFMRTLVYDTIRGGHPASEVHIETSLGETIEIRTQGPRDEIQERMIHLKIERDVPIAIITDEQHLHFSLQKIVDNAIKFTETGTITITVKMGRNALVEIWVVDTGCGITRESMEYIFTPHFQEDASIRRSRDGLGLSLFNAKAHVRRNLGGDVTLERSATEGKERGSSFLIRLPITSTTEIPLVGTPSFASPLSERRPLLRSTQSEGALPHTALQPSVDLLLPEAASQVSPTKLPLRKRLSLHPNLSKDYPINFLIAEDNAINRSVAIASLAKLGYSKGNITLAFDGAEAVRHYNASLLRPPLQRFNVILMDIWM